MDNFFKACEIKSTYLFLYDFLPNLWVCVLFICTFFLYFLWVFLATNRVDRPETVVSSRGRRATVSKFHRSSFKKRLFIPHKDLSQLQLSRLPLVWAGFNSIWFWRLLLAARLIAGSPDAADHNSPNRACRHQRPQPSSFLQYSMLTMFSFLSRYRSVSSGQTKLLYLSATYRVHELYQT